MYSWCINHCRYLEIIIKGLLDIAKFLEMKKIDHEMVELTNLSQGTRTLWWVRNGNKITSSMASFKHEAIGIIFCYKY